MAMAFVTYWPISPKRVQDGMVNIIAYELARARIEKQKTGKIHFRPLKKNEIDGTGSYWRHGRIRDIQMEYGNDFRSFVVYITPLAQVGPFGKFPFFPYNFLVSHPSYRGDDSGQIRMIYTHQKDERCPPEAPVVRTVSEKEIQTAMVELQQLGLE
jgi:hypothetical protein